MIKETDTKNRIIFVWLSKEESCDESVLESLEDLYDAAEKEKYEVVVYYSGHEDFIECTVKLLLHQIDNYANGEK